MKTEFDRRCDKLQKQIANATRDLSRRDDSPFIDRIARKALGPLEAEYAELNGKAESEDEQKKIEALNILLSKLNLDWFGKRI